MLLRFFASLPGRNFSFYPYSFNVFSAGVQVKVIFSATHVSFSLIKLTAIVPKYNRSTRPIRIPWPFALLSPNLINIAAVYQIGY